MKILNYTKRYFKYPLQCCVHKLAKLQVRYAVTANSQIHTRKVYPSCTQTRNLGLGPTSKEFEDTEGDKKPQILSKFQAHELILHLTDEERQVLYCALQEYESNRIKEEFEDKLAGRRWRSKFGRPCKVPTLGDVDPTGSYCPVPEDWLKKKYTATVPRPTTKELFHLSLANAIPFVGFGFLDNCIMIVAGDSIESGLSVYITLSTMAAAALGNTFSDIIGIGSSYYVERAAAMLGMKPPRLSPIQLDMPVSRRYSNMGRVVGVTIGCFLGMIPLLFKDDDKKKESKKD